MNNFIKLSNISKSFTHQKNLKVLKKLTYNFKLGKIYSLMGPSGSGKSTLLNLLSLIDRPSSGIMKYGNKQIDYKNSNYNDILRANKIGIIYQQDNLLPDFTALENVYLANLAIEKNKEISEIKSKKLLKKVGLSNRIYHYPAELSGGEKQRAALARAIINNPMFLFLDEPTGNLDIENSNNIQNLIFEISKKYGVALITATHDNEFIKLFDRVYRLENSKLSISNE